MHLFLKLRFGLLLTNETTQLISNRNKTKTKIKKQSNCLITFETNQTNLISVANRKRTQTTQQANQNSKELTCRWRRAWENVYPARHDWLWAGLLLIG